MQSDKLPSTSNKPRILHAFTISFLFLKSLSQWHTTSFVGFAKPFIKAHDSSFQTPANSSMTAPFDATQSSTSTVFKIIHLTFDKQNTRRVHPYVIFPGPPQLTSCQAKSWAGSFQKNCYSIHGINHRSLPQMMKRN
jgi:hypothetical protein